MVPPVTSLPLPVTETLKASLANLSRRYPGPPPAKIPQVVCGAQKACGQFAAKYNTAIDMAAALEILSSTQIKIGNFNATVYLVERKSDGKERAVYIGATVEDIKLKKSDHVGSSTKGEVLDLQTNAGAQKKKAGSALWPWKLSEESLVAFRFSESEVIDAFPKMYAAAQKAAGVDVGVKLYGHIMTEKQLRGSMSVLGIKNFVPSCSKLADLYVQLDSLPPQDLCRENIANYISPDNFAYAKDDTPLAQMVLRVQLEGTCIQPAYLCQPVDLVMARDMVIEAGACVLLTITQ